MTTRQKVVALAKEIGATITEDNDGFSKSVCVESPNGHHWNDCEVHELVGQYYTHKSEVWADLLSRMETGVERCHDGCEYWEN